MSNKDKIILLKNKAKELRKTIITMIHNAKSGHPGGSLSIADIVTVLYFNEMNVDTKNPKWVERDRLVLSKGHACPVIYSALALKGFYDMKNIYTLRKLGSMLQGHPDMKRVPGLDMTTGSLGQGLSIAVGMAIALKKDGRKAKVFSILGDGEINEGQIWEAAMLANKMKLGNLTAIIDFNNLQLDGTCDEIMPIEPVDKKWEAFGWRVIKIDGHDIEQIMNAFEERKKITDQPVVIIAKTIKGKGVSYMENICGWHGVAPNDKEFEQAINEICEVKVDE